jgi:dCMP deaminase
MDCARAIVQVGITELIAIKPDLTDPQWGEAFSAALELFAEAGVRVRYYKS